MSASGQADEYRCKAETSLYASITLYTQRRNHPKLVAKKVWLFNSAHTVSGRSRGAHTGYPWGYAGRSHGGLFLVVGGLWASDILQSNLHSRLQKH